MIPLDIARQYLQDTSRSYSSILEGIPVLACIFMTRINWTVATSVDIS